MGGWDAWNVTEDTDLGLRLARFGYGFGPRPATYEEAPAPFRLVRPAATLDQGLDADAHHAHARALAARGRSRARARGGGDASGDGALVGPMFGPAFALAFFASAASGELFSREDFASLVAAALWCVVGVGGLAAALWPALIGLRRQGLLRLALWTPLLPYTGRFCR